ncbi:MAG: FGGY family carbohydrate kinase [Planctomycetota bacterium]
MTRKPVDAIAFYDWRLAISYLLGYDIGSSSIKASLVESLTGSLVASSISPKIEMGMIVRKPGWAEQEPRTWWKNVVIATAEIRAKSGVNPSDIAAIGISYQMHGLVLVNKKREVLRPAIIWCDGRAVGIGEKAAQKIGRKKCLKTILNYPGNFTASKLRWVMENEPGIYRKVFKFMLPGEYIAMLMTGEITTTVPGLSEEMLWDYEKGCPASILLDAYKIAKELIPEVRPTFSQQGELADNAAEELGLKLGTPVTYRAGDQPNNALSLSVTEPGEVAATAGTSGVVFGITDKKICDVKTRINTFVHVSHTEKKPRYGAMVCINGTGILNSWLKRNVAIGTSYDEMNREASAVAPGSEGLSVLPYGNGAERTLQNHDPGCSLHGLNFNIHGRGHLFRAAQEGIVFAMRYGLNVMESLGMKIETVRAGNTNMFLSPVFREAFVNTTSTLLEIYETDGSRGAALGAGIGAGIYRNYKEAFSGLKRITTIEPDRKLSEKYREVYSLWNDILNRSAGRPCI